MLFGKGSASYPTGNDGGSNPSSISRLRSSMRNGSFMWRTAKVTRPIAVRPTRMPLSQRKCRARRQTSLVSAESMSVLSRSAFFGLEAERATGFGLENA